VPLNTRARAICCILLVSIALGGCAIVASPVGNGFAYTSVKGPVATGTSTGGSREGRACASNYVGFVAVGDASIAAAKQQGGITSVAEVDHDSTSVLGVYSRFCTVVRGEK
jgi:TRL (tRNA-associated locus)-like protein